MPDATFEVTVTADSQRTIEEWRHWLEKATDGQRSRLTFAIKRIDTDDTTAEFTTANNHE